MRFGRSVRHAMVLLHRYVGLAIATFLTIACVTGSAIVFHDELDALVNARVAYVTPLPAARRIDLPALRERAERQLPPGYSVGMMQLSPSPADRSVPIGLNYDGSDRQRHHIAYVDPYSGRLLGLRDAEDIADPRNLMHLLLVLHVNLILGSLGSWLLGITAVLWTIDCFVGFYLTLPPSGSGKARKGWWARWMPSWLIRAGSSFAAIFSFHRAAGLWVWPVLLVFAWSSVSILMDPVYRPVMSTMFHFEHGDELPELPAPRFEPRLSWEQGLARGEALMAMEAARRGFTIREPGLFSHEPHFGLYRYQVASSLDPGDKGDTTVWMDSDTGVQKAFWAPTGRSDGETVDSWLRQLHFGTVLGLPWRIFIVLVGIVAAGLSITGVIIWLRKRRGREGKRDRKLSRAGSA